MSIRGLQRFVMDHKLWWTLPVIVAVGWVIALLFLQQPEVGTFQYRMF